MKVRSTESAQERESEGTASAGWLGDANRTTRRVAGKRLSALERFMLLWNALNALWWQPFLFLSIAPRAENSGWLMSSRPTESHRNRMPAASCSRTPG